MDITKLRIIDLFSPMRWRAVFISLLQKLLALLDGEQTIAQHVIEQYMFRLLQCPDCVREGSCKHCGCSVPEKLWVKTDHCSNFMWGPFMTMEAWEEHKRRYNLKFSVSYDFAK